MAYPGSGPQWPSPPPPPPPPPGGGWQPPPPGAAWTQPQPVDPARADRAARWFKDYAGGMTVVYLLVVGGGVFFLSLDVGESPEELTDQRITAAVYVGAGLLGLVFHAVALFLPRRPWGWVYAKVVIAIGMSSFCLLAAAIPLLIAWLKPEMKARFNMS